MQKKQIRIEFSFLCALGVLCVLCGKAFSETNPHFQKRWLTAQFFAEKLNVPVEYFNPLRNVQIDPAINLEELAKVAHSMGEVVGLGLRNLARTM